MRSDQAFNPFLPSYEYIPDGEPHVFDGRVYVFGSHDLFGGRTFCMGDYVCWSAPCCDLKDWRFEGVIYRKNQDPMNKSGRRFMYAPDVCRGADGKYYLYYFVGYSGLVSVACCPEPAGKYEFLDYVHYKDGTLLGRRHGDVFQFDPGVFADGENTYLYSGFCPGFYPLILGKHQSRRGPVCVKLDGDMVTIESDPVYIGVECACNAKNTPYFGHGFFEAASLRKIKNQYYFIYSSQLGHELCYAVSSRPDGDFKFQGTLISIGNVGLNGIKGVSDADNFCGNTHGSILENEGKYYIFYHRQTNRHCFSRQACAEEIFIGQDGKIAQVETTSCGLNGAPLKGEGKYEARIACVLKSKKGGAFYMPLKTRFRPFFTQSGVDRENSPDQYIKNFGGGDTAGFKYFDFKGLKSVCVETRGNFSGQLNLFLHEKGDCVGKINVAPSKTYGEFFAEVSVPDGVHALFFKAEGKGKLDFKSFTLNSKIE